MPQPISVNTSASVNTLLETGALDRFMDTNGFDWLISDIAVSHPDFPPRLVDAVNASKCFATNPPDPTSRPVRSVAVYFYAFGTGGGERVTQDVIQRLRAAGLDVLLLTDLEPQPTDLVVPGGVDRVVLGNSDTLPREKWAQREDILRQALTSHNVDVVLFNHWYVPTLACDMLAARSLGIRCYCLMQSSLALFFNLPIMTCSSPGIPWDYALFDGMACLSEADRYWLGQFNSNVVTTINPVTISASCEKAPLAGHTVIWSGRLHPDKSPEQAVRIMAELVKLVPDAHLLFVGPEDEAVGQQVRSLAQDLHVSDHITYCGTQAPAQMESWYRKADAYLLTSRQEGWSLSLAEALAVGLPCVMYDIPYLTLVRNNSAVLSAPQEDAITAAQLLARVLRDKDYARQLQAEGRSFIAGLEQTDLTKFWLDLFQTSALHGVSGAQTSGAEDVPSELGSMAWSTALDVQSRRMTADFETICNLRQQVVELQARLNGATDALSHVQDSTSFKLGRALTALPRKIRKQGL